LQIATNGFALGLAHVCHAFGIVREFVHPAFRIFGISVNGALVRSVRVSGHEDARSLVVDRELVGQIRRQSLEGE
jgi:hypothetical protein